MYQQIYEKWMNHPNLNPAYKETLKQMTAEEIKDSFYTNIAFGTAGMRGLLGPGTNRINIHTIRKANEGFYQWIQKHGEQAKKQGIAIAYDNRHMSYEFAMDSAKYFASKKVHTYVFPQLRPTPELSFTIRHFQCFGGIMITASHNPKEYNGYKLYDATGCQLVPALAEEVVSYVNQIEDELSLSYKEEEGMNSYIHILDESVDQAYYQKVKEIQLRKDVHKEDLTIIFSPVHGTANIPVQKVFEETGYKCIPVTEQCFADPDFINTKSCNPEEKEAYTLAIEYAKKYHGDIILVCDPDADRMGVGVLHKGDYVLLSGNQSGAILIEYICSYLTKYQKMPNNPIMFNTIVTSDVGEKIAKSYGVATEKTLTGFKFIGEKIAKYEKTKEKNYIFGYEESYGSLIAPFVRDKDAVQACLLLAEASAYYKQHNKTLVDVLHTIYETHGFYEESQTSLTLTGKKGNEKMLSMLSALRQHPLQEVNQIAITKIEDYLQQIIIENNISTPLLNFTKANVLKYYLEDGSWIAIRPSGTEPKCKFYYCIKGNSLDNAKEKTKNYHLAIQHIIEKINE